LRRYVVLKALDGILKISSAEEFGEKHYKIWDIEINSFEDLEKSRAQLQEMYEKFENYDIHFESEKYTNQKSSRKMWNKFNWNFK
jgi:hypothetical protein